jgi:hypothetical protein
MDLISELQALQKEAVDDRSATILANAWQTLLTQQARFREVGRRPAKRLEYLAAIVASGAMPDRQGVFINSEEIAADAVSIASEIVKAVGALP